MATARTRSPVSSHYNPRISHFSDLLTRLESFQHIRSLLSMGHNRRNNLVKNSTKQAELMRIGIPQHRQLQLSVLEPSTSSQPRPSQQSHSTIGQTIHFGNTLILATHEESILHLYNIPHQPRSLVDTPNKAEKSPTARDYYSTMTPRLAHANLGALKRSPLQRIYSALTRFRVGLIRLMLSINLCSGDTSMAQLFLDCTKIIALVQHMKCSTMAQCTRSDLLT